jgi:hypothetical protein
MTLPNYGPPSQGTGCAVIDPNPDGTRGTHPCNQPATWHIAWELRPEGARTSLICDNHMDSLRANFVYADRHPVGTDCTRVGARWSDSRIGAWCTAPEDAPDLDEVKRSPVEAAVDAMQRFQSTLLFSLHPDLQGPEEEPTA